MGSPYHTIIVMLVFVLVLHVLTVTSAVTPYCDDCTQVTLTSTGGASEHQPSLLGTYTLVGYIWGGLVPYYKSHNNHYLTPDRLSDPVNGNYLKWIVSDVPMGYNGGIQNRIYTEGVMCPYQIRDMWEYLYKGQWIVDQTIVVCVQIDTLDK